jgi:hypothetical protein
MKPQPVRVLKNRDQSPVDVCFAPEADVYWADCPLCSPSDMPVSFPRIVRADSNIKRDFFDGYLPGLESQRRYDG